MQEQEEQQGWAPEGFEAMVAFGFKVVTVFGQVVHPPNHLNMTGQENGQVK